MADRRKNPRWESHLLVELENRDVVFEAVGINFSTGGLCLFFPDSPAPQIGDTYGLKFRFPNLNESVENAVEIRWVDKKRKKLCGGSFVRGLRAREVYALQQLIKNS